MLSLVQSSCGQPDLEAENADTAAEGVNQSQSKPGKCAVSNSILPEKGSCADSGQNLSTHKSSAIAGGCFYNSLCPLPSDNLLSF